MSWMPGLYAGEVGIKIPNSPLFVPLSSLMVLDRGEIVSRSNYPVFSLGFRIAHRVCMYISPVTYFLHRNSTCPYVRLVGALKHQSWHQPEFSKHNWLRAVGHNIGNLLIILLAIIKLIFRMTMFHATVYGTVKPSYSWRKPLLKYTRALAQPTYGPARNHQAHPPYDGVPCQGLWYYKTFVLMEKTPAEIHSRSRSTTN